MGSSGLHGFTHAAAYDDEQGVPSAPSQQAEENKDNQVRELVDRFFNSPNGSPLNSGNKSNSKNNASEPEESEGMDPAQRFTSNMLLESR
jgi:hypothetical protein